MAKYCGNCGRELSDEAKFCPNCGQVHLMTLITEALQILLKALPKRVPEMIRKVWKLERNFLSKRYA